MAQCLERWIWAGANCLSGYCGVRTTHERVNARCSVAKPATESLLCCAVLWPIFLAIQILFIALSDFSNKGAAIAWVALLYGPILFLSILINALAACYATRSIGGSFTEVIFVPLGFAFTCEHDEGVFFARHVGCNQTLSLE